MMSFTQFSFALNYQTHRTHREHLLSEKYQHLNSIWLLFPRWGLTGKGRFLPTALSEYQPPQTSLSRFLFWSSDSTPRRLLAIQLAAQLLCRSNGHEAPVSWLIFSEFLPRSVDSQCSQRGVWNHDLWYGSGGEFRNTPKKPPRVTSKPHRGRFWATGIKDGLDLSDAEAGRQRQGEADGHKHTHTHTKISTYICWQTHTHTLRYCESEWKHDCDSSAVGLSVTNRACLDTHTHKHTHTTPISHYTHNPTGDPVTLSYIQTPTSSPASWIHPLIPFSAPTFLPPTSHLPLILLLPPLPLLPPLSLMILLSKTPDHSSFPSLSSTPILLRSHRQMSLCVSVGACADVKEANMGVIIRGIIPHEQECLSGSLP